MIFIGNNIDNYYLYKDKIEEYFLQYKIKIKKILTGKQLVWQDAFYMPPPNYPEQTVTNISTYHVFDWFSLFNNKTNAARIDFCLSEDSYFCGTLNLGFLIIRLELLETNDVQLILSDNTKFSIKPAQNRFFSLSVINLLDTVYLWAGGNRKILLYKSQSYIDNNCGTYLSIHQGSLGILGYQKWDLYNVVYEYPLKITDTSTQYSIGYTNFFVRQWEERARKLWHMAVAIRACADLVELDTHNKLPDFFILMAKLITSALSHFSHWRPSRELTPQAGEWERGNWSNGFLLGAFGLMTGVLKDFDILHINESHLKSDAINKGINWLLCSDQNNYTTLDFPPAKHWIKRSTNHGIVILSSALIGLSEINRTLKIPEFRSTYNYLHEQFSILFQTSFQNGVYLEGIRYAQFSLQESIAYLLYLYNQSNMHWKDFCNTNFPVLKEIKHYIETAAYPGSQVPYVNWGDCQILPWKISVLYFFDSVDGGTVGSVSSLVYNNGMSVSLLETNDNEILKTEPLKLPTLLLPNKQNHTCDKSAQLVNINNEIITYESYSNNISYPDWKLYIAATRIHLTHNKDHDCGNFFLASHGKLLLGKLPGRALYNHSTVGIKGVAQHSDNIYSCYGAESGGKLHDRNYGYTVTTNLHAENIQLITINAKGFIPKDGKFLIRNFQRNFLIIGNNPPLLLVITNFDVHQGYAPFINYVLPSACNLSIKESSDRFKVSFRNFNNFIQILKLPGYESHLDIIPADSDKESKRVVESYSNPNGNITSVFMCDANREKAQISLAHNSSNTVRIERENRIYTVNLKGQIKVKQEDKE